MSLPFRRTAPAAAGIVLAFLTLWLLLGMLSLVLASPAMEVRYPRAGQTAMVVAAAWVLHSSLAHGRQRRWFGFAAAYGGLALARIAAPALAAVTSSKASKPPHRHGLSRGAAIE